MTRVTVILFACVDPRPHLQWQKRGEKWTFSHVPPLISWLCSWQKPQHDMDVTWVDLYADASPSGFPTKGFHRRVRMMSFSPDTESQQSQPAGLWIWHTSVVILSHLYTNLTHQHASYGISVLVSIQKKTLTTRLYFMKKWFLNNLDLSSLKSIERGSKIFKGSKTIFQSHSSSQKNVVCLFSWLKLSYWCLYHTWVPPQLTAFHCDIIHNPPKTSW